MKRTQFPVVMACALTIHKPQGGTYDRIAYQFNKTHSQQLVYVALALEGLFVTNTKDDFTFYHKVGSEAPDMRRVRNEYKRQENHPMPTLTKKITNWLPTKPDQFSEPIVLVNLNA